ncbi:Peptide transporter family 1 [Eumeta japonica]|uniref:Peptide transporter family 1 n=1 Tax=Eumeta variegata TaxID=151549 RepID=A0A4C1TZW7_EUMVA|nr:Peptide transporter family 1 [Eumeta japonica]
MKAVMTAVWLLTEAAGNAHHSHNQTCCKTMISEAPVSMKAVMTVVWLLTVAGGNVLIVVIIRLSVNYDQATQFFMYTGLMFVAMTIFQLLAKRYKFSTQVSVVTYESRKSRSNSEVVYLQVKQAEDRVDS